MALVSRAGEAGGFDSGGDGVGVDRRACSWGISGTAGGTGWERKRPALELRRSELEFRRSTTGVPFGIVLDDWTDVGVTAEGGVDWDSGSVVAEFDLNQPNVLRFVFALVGSVTNDDALDNDLITPPPECSFFFPSFSSFSIAFCVRRYNSDFV